MQAVHRSPARPKHRMYSAPTLEQYGTLREVTLHKKKKRHFEHECSEITHFTLRLNHEHEEEDDEEHHCMSG
jgi:hypothetical protein